MKKSIQILSALIGIALLLIAYFFFFGSNLNKNPEAKDAYSKNSIKENLSMETAMLVYDADGNAYTTIKVGNQVWMAENLRTTTCRDGTKLEIIAMGITSKKEGMYWPKNDSASNDAIEYGALYNWTAIETCEVCPEDFKIPTRREWNTLIRFWYGKDGIQAGMEGLTYASYKLREPGQRLWSSIYKYTDSIPALGFNAKPGGWLEKGKMQFYGERTAWWGRRDKMPNAIKIADGDGGVWGAEATPEYALYIRCVKYR